jgi:hypothetical protein
MGINAALINSKTFPVEIAIGTKAAKAKKIYGRLAYPFFILLIGGVICFFVGGINGVPIVLIVTMCAALYVGWQSLSEYQIFKNTPISKIDGAMDALCEIQANFEPEDGKLQTNPITGEPCLYYRLELHYKTSGKNAHDYVEWSHEVGSPSLLRDDTGYIYGNYGAAEFGFYENTYPIRDRKWIDLNQRNEIYTLLNTTTANGTLDFSKFTDTLKIDTSTKQKPQLNYTSMESHRSTSGFYLLICYLPSNIPYFIMSGVSDSGKRYKDKILKLVSLDQSHKIFSILPEPKEKAIGTLRNSSIFNFVLAVFCLVAAILVVNSFWLTPH